MQTYNFNPVNALKWLVNGQKRGFQTGVRFFGQKKSASTKKSHPNKEYPTLPGFTPCSHLTGGATEGSSPCFRPIFRTRADLSRVIQFG
jgi:hypothetical protein